MWRRLAVPALILVLTFVIRVWGINHHFWLLGDQIRDWSIALGPITSLPLIGPPTHVHGYTIGPAFYWILWTIRVVIGPWFQNLPHGGGIGQALLQSGADALFVAAVWKRTGSAWLGLAAVTLVATAPFDLALSAIIWNPVVGSVLAKTATALALLDWHRQSLVRVGVTAAVAWSAVHAYTGAVFVALGIFAALVGHECRHRDWRGALRRGLVVAGVVGVLQIPLTVHQVARRFSDPAMNAVTGSIARIVRGDEQVHLTTSATDYVQKMASIQSIPWSVAAMALILLGCAIVVATRYRQDPVLLSVTLLPQATAILGYAFYLGDLQSYYYLSLMPAAVLTILLGATALLPSRIADVVIIALFVGAVAIIPARLRVAATMFRLPAYDALVAGSREIVKRRQPMRAVETEFKLPPSTDPAFLFRVLGGRIDRRADWRAIISPEGRVEFRSSVGSSAR